MDAENNVVDDNMNKEDQQRLDNDNEAQPVELNDEHPNVDNSNQLNTNHRRLVLDNEGKELDDDDEQEPQKTEDIVEDAHRQDKKEIYVESKE